jgi:hypothetical protein
MTCHASGVGLPVNAASATCHLDRCRGHLVDHRPELRLTSGISEQQSEPVGVLGGFDRRLADLTSLVSSKMEACDTSSCAGTPTTTATG